MTAAPPIAPPADLPPDPMAPPDPTQDQAVLLSSDQLNAAGMAGAQPGQTWTLSVTVNSNDESGAMVNIDHAEQEGGEPTDAENPEGKAGMPKLRQSMTPNGPGEFGI